MEDVSIEALIAEVIADPKPERVPCRPAEPISVGEPSVRRSIRDLAGKLKKRITGRS